MAAAAAAERRVMRQLRVQRLSDGACADAAPPSPSPFKPHIDTAAVSGSLIGAEAPPTAPANAASAAHHPQAEAIRARELGISV